MFMNACENHLTLRLFSWPQAQLNNRPEASITYYVCQYVFPIYLSHFSSEWTEIWHDDSLDGIDRAYSQNVMYVMRACFWSRLGLYHLESHHAKFQSILMKSG